MSKPEPTKAPDTGAEDFTSTPAFQAAVEKAAADAVASILAKINDGSQAKEATGSNTAFAESLALAIAQLSDPGKQHVPPDVLRGREVARTAMVDTLIALRKAGRVPTYTLRNHVWLGEELIPPLWIDSQRRQRETEIDWEGVPNEAMVPLNDAAKAVHEQFLLSIGTPSITKEDSRAFVLTPGGVVVRGAPRPGRHDVRDTMRLPGAEDSGMMRATTRREEAGSFQNINVLGTVAQPAQQTV